MRSPATPAAGRDQQPRSVEFYVGCVPRAAAAGLNQRIELPAALGKLHPVGIGVLRSRDGQVPASEERILLRQAGGRRTPTAAMNRVNSCFISALVYPMQRAERHNRHCWIVIGICGPAPDSCARPAAARACCRALPGGGRAIRREHRPDAARHAELRVAARR